MSSTARIEAQHVVLGRALAHEQTLREVLPALRAQGVEPLLIKGPGNLRR